MAEARQARLKEDFFIELNDFAKSNVSMALIFWLLSTQEVKENVIRVGRFQKPNLAFLKVMSIDKIYMLHALILHDGLKVEQLAEVLNLSENSVRLSILSLLEDGVILQEDTVFMINPMVYRGMVSLLKAKNLIH